MPPPEKTNSEARLEFTGERFIPHETDPLLALEHYHRYCFASRLASDKRVLDAGCGEGYGSVLLSQTASEVVGIDIDPATVEHARAKYSPFPNLTFEVGRCEECPQNSDPFDMVVAFELLEHLGPEEQAAFLQNVRRVLKRDGTLVVSSPERREYENTYQSRNEFHKHELTLPELKILLESCFGHVSIFAQRVLSVSAVWSLENWRGAQLHLDARKDLLQEIPPGESLAQPLYLIAVCSHAPIPGDVAAGYNSFYLDATLSDQINVFSRWALQLNAEARKSREAIQSARKELEKRTTWALDQDARIKAQSELVEGLNKELADRTNWIQSLQQQYAERTRWAQSLESDLAKTLEMKKELHSSLLYRVLSKIKLLPEVWGK